LRVPSLHPILARLRAPPVTQDEMLGLRLLSLHNLWFVLRLTDGARTAILHGDFERYRAETLDRLARRVEEQGREP
jgi:tRNA-guanine family transglycosylase